MIVFRGVSKEEEGGRDTSFVRVGSTTWLTESSTTRDKQHVDYAVEAGLLEQIQRLRETDPDQIDAGEFFIASQPELRYPNGRVKQDAYYVVQFNGDSYSLGLPVEGHEIAARRITVSNNKGLCPGFTVQGEINGRKIS